MESELDHVLASEIPRLLHLAERLSGSLSEAEDLTQETLIRAIRKRPDLEDSNSCRAWLTRVLVNLWRSRLRKRARHGEVSLDRSHAECTSQTPSPMELAIGSEVEERIRRALAGLPPHQRAVMVLTVYEALPVSDIARLLNVSASQVKANLWHARQVLKKELAEHLGR